MFATDCCFFCFDKYNNYTKHTDFLILYIIYILSMFLGYQSAKVFILKTYIFRYNVFKNKPSSRSNNFVSCVNTNSVILDVFLYVYQGK
jgi:hypothetical protein